MSWQILLGTLPHQSILTELLIGGLACSLRRYPLFADAMAHLVKFRGHQGADIFVDGTSCQ